MGKIIPRGTYLKLHVIAMVVNCLITKTAEINVINTVIPEYCVISTERAHPQIWLRVRVESGTFVNPQDHIQAGYNNDRYYRLKRFLYYMTLHAARIMRSGLLVGFTIGRIQ